MRIREWVKMCTEIPSLVEKVCCTEHWINKETNNIGSKVIVIKCSQGVAKWKAPVDNSSTGTTVSFRILTDINVAITCKCVNQLRINDSCTKVSKEYISEQNVSWAIGNEALKPK